MEESTTNLREDDDVFSLDEDEMNKNERNILEIEEKRDDREIGSEYPEVDNPNTAGRTSPRARSCTSLEVSSVVVDDKAYPNERESETTYRTSTGSLTDFGRPDSPKVSPYSRLNDVLDVAARREDPRQSRGGDAYEGHYDSGLHLGKRRRPSPPDADCNPLEVLSVVVDDKAFRPERESETTYRTSTGSLTDLGRPGSPAVPQYRKFSDVLDVAGLRGSPRQNRAGDAYEGNYDSALQLGDPGLNNAPSEESLATEDVPLIEKGKMRATKHYSPPKKILYYEDYIKVDLIRAAEEAYWMSSSSSDKVNCNDLKRQMDIATALYLDDEKNLEIFVSNGPPLSKREIQRHILEAVELNSLKCLDVFCQLYEKNPVSTERDVELFHRRYGLSFWPLDERPKETALHVLASKITSAEAMKVLENHPKFLNNFSDVADSLGSTPLLLAIKCSNKEVVQQLLLTKPRPDVSKQNRHNESPIYVAALNDDAEVIYRIMETYSESQELTKLLQNMKDIDANGHSILYPASQSGKPKVLNLVMEHNWWADFLEKEETTKEWELFACNVCAAGCKSLAKIILEKDARLLDNTKEGVVTPLMSAAKANQEEIVSLIFVTKGDGCLVDLFTVCDKRGQNVFHYAVKNPKVLECLLSKFVSLTGDYGAINKSDNFDNTPIKLAAVGKLTKSFEMLLRYTTSKVNMFSAHLIHNVDIKVLKIGLRNWKEEDPEAVACLLRGDHEKHQPFLEAAKGGNIALMECLLKLGANHLQRTPNDQTALHYAVLSGKLDAVKYLLKKEQFFEMIDFTDEINITAAGYATQTGYSEILRYLLENNAKMKSDKKTARLNILDSAYGFFKTGENSIKEIVEFCTKDGKTEMLQQLFEDSHFGADCIMSKLIEETPNVAMLIFDLCVYQNKYFTHRSYSETKVERRVSYSLFPFKPKGKPAGKLETIQSMVDNKRDDCLGHPLVILFLNEKMRSSKIQNWFILNILMYITFLLALTTYGAIQSQGIHDLKSGDMIALSVIILIICSLHLMKEAIQMVISKVDYIKDFENYIEWVMYICAVIYVVPGGSTKADVQIAAGAISVFLGWINFSLFLKRFSLFGIYIIMAKRVFLTVCKVLPLVVLFIAAFSLSLSLLMPQDPGFKNVPISLLTTFVMMTGELDYRDTFLAGGPLHVLQKILLVLFILVISIAIMNLLTGLAVDDTNEIMNRSKEEKRIYKAMLVITLERNLHNFPLFSPPEIKYDDIREIPEKQLQCTWLLQQWKKVYDEDEVEERLKVLTSNDEGDCGEQLDELRREIKKTNELVQESATAMETRIEHRLKRIEAMLAQIQT